MEFLLDKRYRITYSNEYVLGKGSYGVVVKGFDSQKNDEPVAIKHIQFKKLLEEDGEYMISALNKEIEILQMIDSPYSTRLLDLFKTESTLYLVMELCDSDLQKELIKNNGPFDAIKIKKIMTQLNQVFLILYEKKIIHRDLKLQNIFIKYTNEAKTEFDVKLGDFGFSTITENNIAKTCVGTPITMAPEVMDNKRYTAKADLWSIGIIMYMLHYARLPFPFVSELQYRITLEMFKPKFSSENKDLDDLIEKLLQPKEEKRISWEDYFNHPFFGTERMKVDKRDDKIELTSVYHAANGLHKPNPKPAKEITNDVPVPIKNPQQSEQVDPFKKYEQVEQPQQSEQSQIQNILPREKHTIILGEVLHKFSNTNYVCCQGKIAKSKGNVIVKQYNISFVNRYREQYNKEIELFKLLNKNKIPSLVFKDHQHKHGVVTLIFENKKNVIVLSDYIRKKTISERCMYNIIRKLITDIIRPLAIHDSIIFDLISLDSFLIDKKTGNIYIFDCGIHKYLYTPQQVKDYFIYPDQIPPLRDQKTNILNLGITLYKTYFQIDPIVSPTSKEINLPQGIDCSDDFKQFLGRLLCRRIEKRATWNELKDALWEYNEKSANKSLLQLETIEHIVSSFFIKSDIIVKILKLDVQKKLSPNCKIMTAMFIFLIYSDVKIAKHLFKDLSLHKKLIDSSLSSFKMDSERPSSQNPECLCINFKQVPEEKRFLLREVETQLKAEADVLEEIKKNLVTIFTDLYTKEGNTYTKKKCKETLEMAYKLFLSDTLWAYVVELSDYMDAHPESKTDVGMYLKYVLEYTIVIYHLVQNKQTVLEGAFYEINDFYNDENTNTIAISMKLPKKDKKQEINVFTSFLAGEFEKIDTKDKKENKEMAKKYIHGAMLKYNLLNSDTQGNKI